MWAWLKRGLYFVRIESYELDASTCTRIHTRVRIMIKSTAGKQRLHGRWRFAVAITVNVWQGQFVVLAWCGASMYGSSITLRGHNMREYKPSRPPSESTRDGFERVRAVVAV